MRGQRASACFLDTSTESVSVLSRAPVSTWSFSCTVRAATSACRLGRVAECNSDFRRKLKESFNRKTSVLMIPQARIVAPQRHIPRVYKLVAHLNRSWQRPGRPMWWKRCKGSFRLGMGQAATRRRHRSPSNFLNQVHAKRGQMSTGGSFMLAEAKTGSTPVATGIPDG